MKMNDDFFYPHARPSDRYEYPVGGMTEAELRPKMKAAVDAVHAIFPKTDKLGVLVMVFDTDEHPEGKKGGLAYGASAERADMIRVLRELLARQDALS